MTEPAAPTAAACVMPAAAPSVPLLRCLTRRLAAAWDLPGEPRDALALIVTELVTNAVVHSGSPDVVLLLACRGDAVRVEVRDHGRWTPPPFRPPAVPGLAPSCHGRGLALVRAHARCCSVRSDAAGTAVSAEVPRRPAPPWPSPVRAARPVPPFRAAVS